MSTMTEQEFASLSERIRGKLTALAQRFNRASGMEAGAEDIVQEALIALWQLSQKGYTIRDAEALAVRITKNNCVDRYRKQHIRFEPVTDMPIAGDLRATAGTEQKDIETIRAILHRELSESQRHLLYLRNECGLTLDEMAKVTGRPKASIKVAISTARKKMLEKLKTMG